MTKPSYFYAKVRLTLFILCLFLNIFSKLYSQYQSSSKTSDKAFVSIEDFHDQFSKTTGLPDTIIPFNFEKYRHETYVEGGHPYLIHEGDPGFIFEQSIDSICNCNEYDSTDCRKIITRKRQACIYYFEGVLLIITSVNDSSSVHWGNIYIGDKGEFINNCKIVDISNCEILELTLENKNDEGRGSSGSTEKILIDLERKLLLLNPTISKYSYGGSLNGSSSESCNSFYNIENKTLTFSQIDCESSNSTLINGTDQYRTTKTKKSGVKLYKYKYQNGLLIKMKK
jgi:hypothetical protein